MLTDQLLQISGRFVTALLKICDSQSTEINNMGAFIEQKLAMSTMHRLMPSVVLALAKVCSTDTPNTPVQFLAEQLDVMLPALLWLLCLIDKLNQVSPEICRIESQVYARNRSCYAIGYRL